MELPRRAKGDERLQAGESLRLRQRLRNLAPRHDLVSVIACAFDHRTRMLPFIFTDLRMAPAGVRALGSAMVDSGFEKTPIVLQQWNRNFRPSEMKLDGRVPDIFMVSSMLIHSGRCRELIADASRIDPPHRPLIIAGGPLTVYQPWSVFGTDADAPWSADVTVTGEEYVLLALLEVLLTHRAGKEPIRRTFFRARDGGLLDDIPGLVYARGEVDRVPEELVDTGIQRLLEDLDELPDPVLGYRLLELPSRKRTLGARAIEASRVRKHSPIGSVVLTAGCKFRCPYCPIPAYNQRLFRAKSPERIVEDFSRLRTEYGISLYFGADDNFLNNHQRTIDIIEALARATIDGRPLKHRLRWGTEATVHDAYQLKHFFPAIRAAGMRALWMGVEDLTGTLVKKGQDIDKTHRVFTELRRCGIQPMPMMMHHDGQPLYTRGSPYGLLNQAHLLRKAGAVSFQVLMMSPATGTKLFNEAFTSGLAIESANGRRVETHMRDANYVVASKDEQPWRKQVNMLIAYLFFFNPLRLLKALVRPKSKAYFVDAFGQVLGMAGLVHTIRRTTGWAYCLWRGNIVRSTTPPASRIPMRSATGKKASHTLLEDGADAVPVTADAMPEGE